MFSRRAIASPLLTKPAIMSLSNPWTSTSNFLSDALRIAGEQLQRLALLVSEALDLSTTDLALLVGKSAALSQSNLTEGVQSPTRMRAEERSPPRRIPPPPIAVRPS